MDKTSRVQVSPRRKQGVHEPVVFRFYQPAAQRSALEDEKPVSPFTELPDELKDCRSSPGQALQRFLNVLLLLLLGLLLTALVAAFAYQLVFNPERIAQAGRDIVSSAEGLLHLLLSGR